MTRTTGALKRLGVMGIAVATAGAGLIALPATAAFAAPPTTIDISPTNQNAATNTCVAYTITVRDANGQPGDASANNVTVTLQQADTTGATPSTADFCDPTLTTAPVPQGGATTPDVTTGTRSRTFTTSAANAATNPGTVVIGVFDTAFSSTTAVNNITNIRAALTATPTAFDTSTLTVTSTNTANDVNRVEATPPTDTVARTQTQTVNVTLRNAAGAPVQGVQPSATVTGANAGAATTCGTTNNNGVTTCTYTANNAGSDTVTVFVNQTTGGSGTGGADANEPKATVTRQTIELAAAGTTLDLACTGFGADTTQQAQANCIRPFTVKGDTYTATVLNGTTPVAGVVVQFAVTAGNTQGGTVTGAPTVTSQGVTDTNGRVTVVLTAPGAESGEFAVVTATLPRTGGNATDTIRTDFVGTTSSVNNARNVTLSPPSANTTAGNSQTYTATVVDLNGIPVVGATVVFRSSGAGSFTGGGTEFTTTTDGNGQARVTATSASTAASGTQTITAFISQGDCAGGVTPTPNGTGANTTAVKCSDTATNNITARPVVNPGPDTPNPSDTAVARITLNVSSGRITAGNAPRLFGIVTDRNGNPLANRDVTILQKLYNTNSYQELQTPADVTTNTRGEFSILIRPNMQTAYIARATGTSVQSDAAGSTGRAVIVQVYNRINLATPVAGATAAGRALQVRGDLDPNYASVRIGVAALRNGRFTYLTQGITAGDGSFVINVRNLPQGTFALVVYTSARQGNLFGSASRSITAP